MSEGEAAAAKVMTPWGDAARLRSRRLHPSSKTPRAEVIANQRERLFGAIFAVVAEKGYEASTVADVIELSGVSRSAFYAHFANKGECLAAAAAELIQPTMTELRRFDGGAAVLERFHTLAGGQPAAARVWLIELRAAGPAGEEVSDRGARSMAELMAGLAADGAEPGPDPELARVLVGGLRKMIETRLYRGDHRELPGIAPELWRWMTLIVPPPRPLAGAKGQLGAGGRFQGYTPAERIARAVAEVVADRGYLAMSTDDIAAGASISLSTFYGHFSDKRDAVLAALEMSGAQVMALAGPAARRAGDWQHGVRVLYEAICAYLTAEPNLARLATDGVYGAGRKALARRDRVIDSLAAMLAPGFDENPQAPAVSAEAAAAAAYGLIADQVRREGPERLAAVVPLATYITLAAFVGPERAVAIANADGG